MPVDAASSAFEWWASRRARYNRLLLGIIVASVFGLVVLRAVFEDHFPCEKITPISLFLIALICLVSMAVANIFYFLGPLVERPLRPSNVVAYRNRMFWAGVAFSALVTSSLILSDTIASLNRPIPVATSGPCD
ncbi:MAG: hypothetical protein ACXWCY_26300 [Burkholderiales bacterium]